ncbi:MAG: hypothetical protein ACKVT0_03325 [Planctomycetaceae bacterium]
MISLGNDADGPISKSASGSAQVIVLGASNVTLSLPWLIDNLPRGFGEPVSLFAAIGHGRSYGAPSRVLIRELPGILQCRLWSEIVGEKSASARRFALLTDIGNDLLYGHAVDTIADWLVEALDRLQSLHAECVLTRLPLVSVMKMSSARYYATRAVFFPGSRVSWPVMQRRAAELDARIQRLGDERGLAVIQPDGAWYGFDPIHIRLSKRCTAWSHLLSTWSGWNRNVTVQWPRWYRHFQNLRFAAAERKLAGISVERSQPAYQNLQITMRLY